MSTSPSVFSRIVAREIPATVVAEDDRLIAIEDIAPKAPVHVLVVPKTEQYATVAELAAGDPSLLADLVAMAQRVADERAGGQFRLVFNSGASAGQTVFHVHAHVLAGDLQEGTLAG
ncbi:MULTISPECIES: histidine triad nucleotide-binding protein [unclassified Curtobacterium]|uniref:histidine triad nucleotide-binding protein n=1 Tax=unclassified Curtobacterium TaxID=257496 RepID=UPI000DA76F9E|nr:MULTISPECIES: histidine triad nucleotide-binding protein [unclassified Curtobacterium]PZE29953.1 histidine triad nucleotide-binding protein [Curtobacterium sp. MCBD17_028]PZE74500.1 histidine triad nucleotide-binding protein [Curtobacterium sp. MCBD17_019]PZF61004.1 histidine triad nucleotide-binding protein [Curtobacterium sp. MCBD17_034]PZF66268.1 histidine triad nucleotide-binding protein [Curtobacterium sp. MCBD17_013]PZM40354.1 histidine triad nucleotide-binding protein [Curtobacterium